jgi:hypothetical protein
MGFDRVRSSLDILRHEASPPGGIRFAAFIYRRLSGARVRESSPPEQVTLDPDRPRNIELAAHVHGTFEK